MLEARMTAWFQHQQRLTYNEMSATLTLLKRDPAFGFLNEVSSVPLQQAIRHLQRGFVNFWERRAAHPRFHRKHAGGTAEFTRSGFRFTEDVDVPGTGSLTLAKMRQPLRIRWSRPLPPGANPSTVTVSLDPAGRWHISLRVEEMPLRLPPLRNAVGIDLGLDSLITTSDGYKLPNPRHGARAAARLARAQRVLSRRRRARDKTPKDVRGPGRNLEKARRRVARIHAYIADCRRDQLHKLTTRLVRENQTIVVETLAVQVMIKNRRLSKAIADAGWSEFVRQLEYKAQWYGRELIQVDRFFPSSKLCSGCGQLSSLLTLSDRSWVCHSCGRKHDRDVNAAKNVLAAGLAVAACGEGVRRSRSSERQRSPRRGARRRASEAGSASS